MPILESIGIKGLTTISPHIRLVKSRTMSNELSSTVAWYPSTSPPAFEDTMQQPKDSLNLERSPTGQYEETKSNKMPVKANTVDNFHSPPS